MNAQNIPTILECTVQAFRSLLEDEREAQVLKRDLTELLYNYSHHVIEHSLTHGCVAPIGDVRCQLHALAQVIAILDTGANYPLFAELTDTTTDAA